MKSCILEILFLSLLLSAFVLESEASTKSIKGTKSFKSPKDTKSPKATKSPKDTPDKEDEEDEIVVEYEGDGKDAIFNQISASEMESIVDYLKSEGIIHLNRNELESAHSVSNANYAMVYQLFPPPKSEALEYLDEDGPMPARYATVTVNRGAARPRDVMEYKVGPLVDGAVDLSSAVAEPMLEDGEIKWAQRTEGPVDWLFLQGNFGFEAYKLKELLKETTGGYCVGSDEYYYGYDECGWDSMTFWGYTSLDSTLERRIINAHFWLIPPDEDWGYATLHPVPLSFSLVEDPDLDPTMWETYNFEYCYQGPFDSAEDLLTAYENGDLMICQVPNSDLSWSNTNPVPPFRKYSEMFEPVSVYPDGPRFVVESAGEITPEMHRRMLESKRIRSTVPSLKALRHPQLGDHYGGGRMKISPRSNLSRLLDNYDMFDSKGKSHSPTGYAVEEGEGDGTGHMVEWLGWSFHISVDPYHGMIIKNLKFKGIRVAYEISFQDFFASYSSYGSTAQVFYFDSNYEIGTELSRLEAGIDCPENALMLPILVQHFEGVGHTEPHFMCIFEEPMGGSMWRHYYRSGVGAYPDGDYVGGLPRTQLKVRAISTMGNYDYIPTFSFMADGVVHTEMELGGYMLGSYAPDGMDNPESPLFGEKVESAMNGVLHDHIIGLKVDLDVLTTTNTLSTGTVKYGTYEEVIGTPKPAWHSYDGVKYMALETQEVETEFFAKDYDVIYVYANETNSWGAPKGYEIMFDSTVSSQVFPPGHPLREPQEWAGSNLAVTVYKDEEEFCSYPSNFQWLAPISRFDLKTFKDGESIVDEDLVFWVMIGKQHYPKAEDVPLVSNFGTGFWLRPRNLFDRAAFEDLYDYHNKTYPL